MVSIFITLKKGVTIIYFFVFIMLVVFSYACCFFLCLLFFLMLVVFSYACCSWLVLSYNYISALHIGHRMIGVLASTD
jgi:hypothetical protein